MTLRHASIAPAHPGAIIAELIEDLKGNKTAIADALGVTRAALYNVIEEKSAISANMAVRIEKELGVSADLLVNMQAVYDLWQARRNTAPKRAQKSKIIRRYAVSGKFVDVRTARAAAKKAPRQGVSYRKLKK